MVSPQPETIRLSSVDDIFCVLQKLDFSQLDTIPVHPDTDDNVKWLAGRCTCPVQFPITKVGEGKYKIGDSQTLVFVRILRNHVMIRVGGGWDTLEHYLDKHDPCRCGFSGHRNTPGQGTPQRPSSAASRRASTPSLSQTLPLKSPRKLSTTGTVSRSISETQERSKSPVRMRSASPGPSPGKQSTHHSVNQSTKPPVSPLSPTGNVNSINFSGQRTSSVSSTPRRSQSPAPSSRLRSPSPVSTSRSLPQQQTNKVPRPSSPIKRCTSPAPGASPAPKRCASPSFQRAVSMSPAPSRKNNNNRPLVSSSSRSKSIPNTPRVDRRQLPQRPSMDSSGNESEGTDVTSGSTGQTSVDINQISTMTLDEFKNLLNNALSVPNGNASEGSLESPRSQSSTDSSRNISYKSTRKPPISEKPSRYKFSTVSKSVDSKLLNGKTAHNGYFEMEKPAIKKTILASSTVSRPKTPVGSNSVQRPKTPVSSARPKTPVNTVRPTTPVSNVSRPKTPTSSHSVQRPTSSQSSARSVQNTPNRPRPHSKLHESKSDSLITENERPTENIKPNVSYVCISSQLDEQEKPQSNKFNGGKTYTLSNDSLDSTTDRLNQRSETSSRIHRSQTDPGSGLDSVSPESKSDSSNKSDSIIASFNALQKSIQELRNRAQQACISAENKKSETKKTENQSEQFENNVSNNTTTKNVRENANKTEKMSETITIKRPSTPTRRPTTPSLIPRPMTPVGSLSKSLSLTQTIETPNTVTQTDKNTVVGDQNRPATPRKTTILAKAPSASRNVTPQQRKTSNTSYTGLYLNRRATTPGPNEFSSTETRDSSDSVRRAITPGPGSKPREEKKYTSPIRKLATNSNQSVNFTAKEIPESDYNTSNTSERKSVPASPRVQRKSVTVGKHISLARQGAVDETIVVNVNRESGRHEISVQEGDDTKYKTGRSAGRIIARAPTPTGQRGSSGSLDRSRTSRSVDAPQKLRPRPRSVDPEHWNRNRNEEEVVLQVKRKESGLHQIQNRTEAWVESAAKSVSGKPNMVRKNTPKLYNRSKTPNPSDIYDYELQSRPLEEIKAALTLPVNGLKEIQPDELDAPPEDPEMYAKMELLFEKMREKELKASVNETPGGEYLPDLDVDCMENDIGGSDELSLDSNENIKQRGYSPVNKFSKPSPVQSSRGSVPSTPRSKTPSFDRSSSGSQPLRPVSTPPRPSTPTRSSFSSSRRSSSKSSTGSVPESPKSGVDHAVILVSKIKEILKPSPRKEDNKGPKSRIPAPKSLSLAGKSKSFSNLSKMALSDDSQKKTNSLDYRTMNGNMNGDYYDDDTTDEISGITSNVDTSISDHIRSQSGTKTPVPKLATPLTTGRRAVLNRESSEKSSKLVRAVSISSLSSSSNNTMSCNYGDDEEYV